VRRHHRDLFAAVMSAPETGEVATWQSYNSAVARLQVLSDGVRSTRAIILWIDAQITKPLTQRIAIDAEHLGSFQLIAAGAT